MTRAGIVEMADRLVRPAFRERDIEEIEVREADDWSGAPSIYVNVFLAPDVLRPDAETWNRVLRRFSDELVAAGDSRFPYVWLRDRREESEDIPDEAA